MTALEDRLTQELRQLAEVAQPETIRPLGSPPNRSRAAAPGRLYSAWARRSRLLSPVAAAVAVVAVAVIAIALAASIQGGPHGTRPTGGAQRAPQYFNPLRPYARFGWLPPGSLPGSSEVISQGAMSLGSPSGAFLVLYAAGVCHVTGHALNCLPLGERYPLGRGVARVRVDGHPAYWTAPQRLRSPFPVSSPGVLAWQYAVGGWAVLEDQSAGPASARNDAVKIAEHVRFGYRGEPAIRFPVQLTHVPANWQVNCVATSLLGHVMYAASDVVTAGRVNGSICGDDNPLNAPHFDAGQGAKNACSGLIYAHPEPEVINGYPVVLGTEKTWPNYELCADDAAGTFVWIAIGAHPALSPASIFAHHLRLLGSNPAKWTTKPIV
jgi:hypothetical protein